MASATMPLVFSDEANLEARSRYSSVIWVAISEAI